MLLPGKRQEGIGDNVSNHTTPDICRHRRSLITATIFAANGGNDIQPPTDDFIMGQRKFCMMSLPRESVYKMEKTMSFENVPDSLKKHAQACETPEELLALAAEEGYELSDEELKAITGGVLYQDCTWDDCSDVNCKLCKGLSR